MQQSNVQSPKSSSPIPKSSPKMTPILAVAENQSNNEPKAVEVPTDMSKLWEEMNRKNWIVAEIIPERLGPFSPPPADKFSTNPNAEKIANKIRKFYGKRQTSKRSDLSHLLD